jgi:hypothetical protein
VGGIGVVQVSEEEALSASATSYGILSKPWTISKVFTLQRNQWFAGSRETLPHYTCALFSQWRAEFAGRSAKKRY